MTRQVRSTHRALSRCRAWLHRLVDDRAYDEWEEDTAPTGQGLDFRRAPQDLIDEMLGDSPHERDIGADRTVRDDPAAG